MTPLFEELETLSSSDGVITWDKSTEKEVKMKAHLVMCSADMVGRAKLLKTLGIGPIITDLERHKLTFML